MSFDLATYKRLAGQLDVDGVDFDAFREERLAPDDLRCLRYMHDVEQHTSCYLRNLLNTKAHNDPQITAFLTMWAYEEYWHGEAIARVLEAHDEQSGDVRVAAMRQRLGWKLTASPLLWMGISATTKHFLAVHMTFGAINEWTTQAGYSRLLARAGHPMLSELLRRIMKQEGRHIDFYRTQAVERLEASVGAQRTTRRMVRALWEPVGAGAMPPDECDHLMRRLFGDEEGEAAADRVDRRVDQLPGLRGLGLMAGALGRYGLRNRGLGVSSPSQQRARHPGAPVSASSVTSGM